MDREQGNFRNSPLAAEWGMTEPGKAEQPPMSNSSCIPGTVGMSKIISSGEESWPGIMSHCPGWVPSCQQGHVSHLGRQQPEQLLMLPLPRMGRCLVLEISERKCINRKETSYFVPSCSQIWWDQYIPWNLMKTWGQDKARLTPVICEPVKITCHRPVKWRHTHLKSISYFVVPGSVFPVLFLFLLLPPLGGASWMLSAWRSSAEMHCTSW